MEDGTITESKRKMHYKLIGSSVAGLALSCTIVVPSFWIGEEPTDWPINLAVITLGFSLGWLLGISLSPYSASEERRLVTYSKALGVFASGYLVGKVDQLVVYVLDPEFLLSTLVGFRLLAFLSALVIAMVITFVFRRYAD